MSEQRRNIYIVEVVHRYNLRGVEIPHVELQRVGSGNFFTVYHAEVSEEHLGVVIVKLEYAEKMGDIISYYYQQKTVK